MAEHFNKLSPAEAERLACLMEEAAEVVQVVGKILRHGYENTYPECGTTNREMLEKELGDLRYWMITMAENRDVSKDRIHEAADFKRLRVQKYLHHQEIA